MNQRKAVIPGSCVWPAHRFDAASLDDRVRRLIPTPLRVHIAGETGTGKNHLAYRFRDAAHRAGQPFVEINVANLPDELFEAELFGYRRGAFTGAVADRQGILERADGGVLFLNEVGEMTPSGQARLLTALDSGVYRRLGDSRERRVSTRVLSATNRDLPTLVLEGAFRVDLYFRLAQVTVELVPLRHRPGEISTLARRFLADCGRQRKRALDFEPAALRVLEADPWPGNVRELRDVVETLAFLAPDDGRIRAAAVASLDRRSRRLLAADIVEPPGGDDLREKVARLEKAEILKALIHFRGNKTAAARHLGLSVPGLRLKLRRFGFPA